MDPEYGTLDRVLNHAKCDEILETLRHMSKRLLPEPGYTGENHRRIVPEVGVWCLLEGLIEVEAHGQDSYGTWYRLLVSTKKGQDVVWDLLHIIKEEGLMVNVTLAYKDNMTAIGDSWHMEGYAPTAMKVYGVSREKTSVMVQHPDTLELYHADLLNIRFAKQTTLEVKNGAKAEG